MLETGAQVVADVLSGKRHPRVASGLAPLLNVLLRAIDTTDIEKGLAEIRKLAESLAESKKAPAGNGDAATSPDSDEPDEPIKA